MENIGIQISGHSLDELLVKSLSCLNEIGKPGTKSTKQLLGAQLILSNPKNIWMVNPHRKHSPVAQIAEVIWVLSGTNEIDWLTHFLPRAPNFSDDGVTWRAGYGPRLFSHTGFDDSGKSVVVDQIQYVIDTLTRDPTSRQAVITIWDPAKDATAVGSKDYACNNLLQFQIQEGKLVLCSYVRSNDIIWGMSAINFVEWCVLQQVIASKLGVEVGYYVHNVGNLHLYEIHEERKNNIISITTEDIEMINTLNQYNRSEQFKIESFDSFKKLFDIELLLRNPKTEDKGISELKTFLETDASNAEFKTVFTIPLLHNRPNIQDKLKDYEFLNSRFSVMHPALAYHFTK